MHRSLASYSLAISLLLLIGCTSPSDSSQGKPTLIPTLPLSTPVPATLPQATPTPFPTIERLPSRTPYPTFPSYLTPIPETATPTLTPPSGRDSASAPPPQAFPTGYVGIQGAGPEVADLAPILTVADSGAVCGQPILIQVGVINRGTGPAYNFTVQWALGIDAEVKTQWVTELQWGTTPLYFHNGKIAIPCTQTTTYTAWINVDVDNQVAELDESNNTQQQTYTLSFVPPSN